MTLMFPHKGYPFELDHNKEEMEHQHREPRKIIENELFLGENPVDFWGSLISSITEAEMNSILPTHMPSSLEDLLS